MIPERGWGVALGALALFIAALLLVSAIDRWRERRRMRREIDEAIGNVVDRRIKGPQ